ncbi:aspartyl-phosphate phosphatase Spo0E family protein [Bacillus sp. SCS-153A]|uniref:aspartyl-phosphate phosphatase Spo0E family protein n=1 Tax=Rossellomorea sedimentorum TaxID=3115294 RepID=UPI0039067A3B
MGRTELLEQIEEHRNQMVELALQSSFANEKVVEISSKLDRLLNTFHQKMHKQ